MLVNDAPAPGGSEGTPAPVTVVTPAMEDRSYSAREAARVLASHRYNKQKEQQAAPVADAPQEAAPAVEPPQELADEANAAPPVEEVPGETQEAEPAVEQLPPIEPPRSWTKEEQERFQSLPRETQEFIARREQERDREIRRSQNEAAEKLKGLTAKEQQAEEARQHYEAALPALLQTLQDQQASEFADIKTMADVRRMAEEDWPRYARWQAHRETIAATQQDLKAAQDRQAQEFLKQWGDFAKAEDQKLIEKVPELADKTKAQKLQESALSVLRDIGFEESELAQAWNGRSALSIRDHRVQMLVLDAVKWRDAQKAKAQVVAKPIPPVQRPGVAPSKGDAHKEQIQTLTTKLEKSGSLKDAAALLAAKRAAGAR